jgi:putative flippase GtrA
MTTPVLDVVVPVHCEEHTVAASVHRLHDHLTDTFPYPFRITVADNASTDTTAAVARAVAAELPHVRVVELPEKGRGRALRRTWLASDAEVLAYVDVDLSTDLDALWPLVAPLLSGHSDLAIGSRLAHGSRVVRGLRREVISRSYNLLLRGALGTRFTDAQCGFKAIRADVAAELLPLVEDDTWFFDTELLVLAERCQLRIHEVPVDWYDDPDSRVDVVGTALDDLRGIRRLRRSLATGALPVTDLGNRLGRHTPVVGSAATTLRQAGRFAVVGAVSTVVHLGLFAALAPTLGSAQGANLVALLLATVVNTALNRGWTFGVRGRHRVARHQAQGLAVFGLTWVLTAAALAGLHWVVAAPSTALATTVLAGATAASTVVRFAAMKSWIFRPDGRGQYCSSTKLPASSANVTIPVQAKPSASPRQTTTTP